MMERTLRSRSFSLVRDVDEASQEASFVETEANNANQETELDRTIVEVNEDIKRQVRAHSESSNNVVMSADQFHKFMSTVRKEFDDLKARMKSENNKLAENIKSASDKMSIKMKIANKNLSDSVTKQLKRRTKIVRRNFLVN